VYKSRSVIGSARTCFSSTVISNSIGSSVSSCSLSQQIARHLILFPGMSCPSRNLPKKLLNVERLRVHSQLAVRIVGPVFSRPIPIQFDLHADPDRVDTMFHLPHGHLRHPDEWPRRVIAAVHLQVGIYCDKRSPAFERRTMTGKRKGAHTYAETD
jgi:hypothetical protein